MAARRPQFAPPPSLYDKEGDDEASNSRSTSVLSSPVPQGGEGDAEVSPVRPVESRFDRCKSILLKHPVELYDVRSVAREGIPDSLRSCYWRVLLGFLPTRSERWAKSQEEAQKTYEDLLKSVLGVSISEQPPLGGTEFRRVDVDIPRTMPALHFFACEEVEYKDGIPISFSPNQNSLRRVLHLYSKLNPGIGYVQGMNEIAGHLLYTFSSSIDESVLPFTERQRTIILEATSSSASTYGNNDSPKVGETTEQGAEGAAADEADDTTKQLASVGSSLGAFDRSKRTAGGDGATTAVEADVFFCLQTMTAYVGDTFCRALDGDATGVTGSMAAFGTLLHCCDSELSQYLESIQLQPTFYAFRWITVLLTQEFNLPEVLRLWDFLLSFGNELRPALFFTAVAMLVLVRDQLLKMSFTEAMPLLQNYPAPDDINDLTHVAEQLMASQGLELVERIQSGEVRRAGDAEDEDDDGANINETVRVAQEKMKGWFGKVSKSISSIGKGGDGTPITPSRPPPSSQ